MENKEKYFCTQCLKWRYYRLMIVAAIFVLAQCTLLLVPFNVRGSKYAGIVRDGYGTIYNGTKETRKPKHELSRSKIKIMNFKDISLWNRTLSPSIYGPEIGQLPIVADKRTTILKMRMHPTEEDFHNVISGKYTPEDVMALGPFQFLEQYRNPCWFDDKESYTSEGLKCLPYFYIIGAPKCGTTDLQKRLLPHPDISDRVVKEPHWLNRNRFFPLRGYVYPKFEHYLTVFSDGTRQIHENYNKSGYHPMIFGDCSATTMVDSNYWTMQPPFRNLSEPLCTNADYINHLNPNTKIIAMLRNPVDRMYSEYLYFMHGSPEEFHEVVKKNILYTRECLEKNSLRYCFNIPPKNYTQAEIMLGYGVYFLHLREFLRVFPRKQIFVIKLEDYSQNIMSYMRRVFTFLEIKQLPEQELMRISNPKQRANVRKKSDREKGEMLDETRKLLEDFYRPYNKLLVELLGTQFNFNKPD